MEYKKIPGELTHMASVESLLMAKKAVGYVEEKMIIGASNKISDVFASLFKHETSLACVKRIRKAEHEDEMLLNVFEAIAKNAEKAGCGNCGEQAAIAFFWLKNKFIGPLDYMSRTNADHAFVVIGRTGAESDVKNWGPECVVCDPWHGRAYPADQAQKLMYGGGVLAPRSVFQWKNKG